MRIRSHQGQRPKAQRQVAYNSRSAPSSSSLGARRTATRLLRALSRAAPLWNEPVNCGAELPSEPEAAQSNAEAQVTELTAAAAVARKDLEMLQTQLAAKEAELAAAERRASVAQRRADDAERKAVEANAAIERIVDAICTQLPVKSDVAPIQTSLN